MYVVLRHPAKMQSLVSLQQTHMFVAVRVFVAVHGTESALIETGHHEITENKSQRIERIERIGLTGSHSAKNAKSGKTS